jgi:hypothetical protein
MDSSPAEECSRLKTSTSEVPGCETQTALRHRSAVVRVRVCRGDHPTSMTRLTPRSGIGKKEPALLIPVSLTHFPPVMRCPTSH